ncbi:MAG: hypothetical protein ACI4VM_04755 [Anaerovoracaceae bacterium]
MKRQEKRNRMHQAWCMLLCVLLLMQWAEPSEAMEYWGQEVPEMTVSPRLQLPLHSWEGHEVVFGDASDYWIGNERKNLADMYKEGNVRAEFSVSDEAVQLHRVSGAYGQKKAVFEAPGSYTVEMTLYLYDGSTYTAKGRISVDPAPEVQSTLSGAQKQYRLQSLSVRCYQNPAFPVEELKIILKNRQAEEQAEVRLIQEGSQNTEIIESKHIFLQNPEVSAEEGMVQGSVEFLAAFSDTVQMEYEIQAVDCRGESSRLVEQFTVKEDEAPCAEINISDSYIREEGSNTAFVMLEDVSTADGDTLQRQWYVREQGEEAYTALEEKEGYMDLSDGMKSRVGFTKEGTGSFSVKLRVTDVWSEGTMEEKSSGWPKLWDETECSSRVTNTAPVVSVGMSPMKSADVVILTAGRSEAERYTMEEAFRQKLLEMKTDAHVQVEQLDPTRLGSGEEPLEECFTRRGDFGYNGSSTSFENGLYLIDDEALYCVDAVWTDPDSGWPEEPYTIFSLDAATGEERWHFQITSEIFSVNPSDAALYQDDGMKYLYLVSRGKTMVISKATGQPVTFLDTAVGEQNFLSGSVLYTCRGTGIFCVSLEDGKSRSVWNGVLSGCVRRMEGKLVTYTRNASGSILRIAVDPVNGEASTDCIGTLPASLYLENGKNTGGTPVLDVVGIDSEGRGIVQINTPLYNEGVRPSVSGYRAVIQVYNRDGSLVKQFVRSSGEPMKTAAVTDRGGRFHYAAVSYSGDDSVSAEIVGIDRDYSAKASASDRNGDPADYRNILYSIEEKDAVYLTLGGYCTWIYNQTWGNGPAHGYPERCLNFRFDPDTQSAYKTSLLPGCVSFSEYARSSSIYTVIHTGRNSQYAGTASLDNTVTRRTPSAQDVMQSVLCKHLRADESMDYKVLIVDGNSIYGKLTDSVKELMKKAAAERGYVLFMTGISASDASSEDCPVWKLEEEENWPSAVFETLSGSQAPVYGSVRAVAGEGGGSLSRILKLSGDRRYYYEYKARSETEGAPTLSVKHALRSILEPSVYGESQWRVYSSVVEDFDDTQPDPFFSYQNFSVSGGMYNDCYASRSAKSNGLAERSSVISFSVPEGSRGVLSFNYRIFNSSDQGRPNANYAEVDGMRWEMPCGTAGSGSYTHPVILEPGEHTLLLHTGGYGGKIVNYTYIDDLKLSWVTRHDPGEGEEKEEHPVLQGDGSILVTGSFMTPGDASVYREMNSIDYVEGQPGAAAFTRAVQISENSRGLYIELPEGKKALSASVTLRSRVLPKYNVSYEMGGYGSLICYGTVKSPGSTLSAVPAEWRFFFPTLTGTTGCTAGYSSYRGTSGSFADMAMYVSDSTNALVEEHRFIKSETESGRKTLFLGENPYDGQTELCLKLPEGSTGLWDFSLYTIENGRKLYLCRDELAGHETQLTWSQNNVSVSPGGIMENGEEDIPIYTKGQTVDYNVEYWDYENDPSGESFWRYVFQPAGEDTFDQAAAVLDQEGRVIQESDQILKEPVTRFYSEGRYIVEHWQKDDTQRNGKGDPGENKESNHVFLTFYVGSLADAPWIRYIRTIPDTLREGDPLELEVSVDDADREELTLETELYLGDKKIGASRIEEILPGVQGYDAVRIRDLCESAVSGSYRAVCTVRDAHGTGIGSYSFRVLTAGSVEGRVQHTEQWEENRQRAGRPPLTFWPGERLMLLAETEGAPDQVTAWIEGETEICRLEESDSGIFQGSLWSEDMMYRWKKDPVEKTVVFCARYGEEEKLSETVITFDNSRLYWNLYQKKGA